jgi:Bacteriodetes cell division protein (FtsL-like)
MAVKLLDRINISQQTTEWVFNNFNYLLFLCFLGVVYIANAHFAEQNVREIQHVEKKIKELKWEYISIKSETMFKSMQSQIDVSLDPTGIDLEPVGPKVIIVE